ncbi:C-type lectin domain family 4 member E-like isoform X2 [Thalassophryne amazonica]|uniref:C-type lectin domain family 4 member E-like isoform X2 n=1 Tax=Thalassophryne amazonica TaxID=390379 RepID=UPI0014726025|nr:C-type lectin domain family 4 member E-like isoform X2 [Thalassophryne amazonica]
MYVYFAERRLCKLVYFSFGPLCLLQAILNISLRLTEPGGCVVSRKCPTGWTRIRNQCYFISTQSKPWTESRADCLSKGADLVVINNQRKQVDLYQLENLNDAFWIGLFYEETSGIFKWVDGTALNTSYWQQGQPDRGRFLKVENCIEIFKPFHILSNWNDLNCNVRRHWICEKDAGSATPT